MGIGWLYLAAASVGEIGFAALLPATQGLTRIGPTIGVVAVGWATTWALSKAMLTLNPAVAYPIWVGCGVVGVIATASLLYRQPIDLAQFFCISLILSGTIGLKLLEPAAAAP